VTCPAGTHRCPGRSSQRCLEENSFCDGTDDCGGNTDEDIPSVVSSVSQSVPNHVKVKVKLGYIIVRSEA